MNVLEHLLAADHKLGLLRDAVERDAWTVPEYRAKTVTVSDHLTEAVAEHRRMVEGLLQ